MSSSHTLWGSMFGQHSHLLFEGLQRPPDKVWLEDFGRIWTRNIPYRIGKGWLYRIVHKEIQLIRAGIVIPLYPMLRVVDRIWALLVSLAVTRQLQTHLGKGQSQGVVLQGETLDWLVVEPTHLKNMIVKMGSSSPRFGVNIKNIWVATTYSWAFESQTLTWTTKKILVG